MKSFLLLLFGFLCAHSSLAQQAPFEQQLVQLADGEEALLWISLDEETELLYFKQTEKGAPDTYQASEVVSFRYRGCQYFTLPLRDGYYTFFKVVHEGQEFAILEKQPSFKALRVVVDESRGSVALCQKRRKDEFYLCFANHTEHRYTPNQLRNPFPDQAIREFKVDKLVYLAIEGKVKLYYLESNERMNFMDDLVDIKPGNRRVEKMLEEFIEDKEKISAIQKKVKQDKLDIRDPKHLILALEAVYQ